MPAKLIKVEINVRNLRGFQKENCHLKSAFQASLINIVKYSDLGILEAIEYTEVLNSFCIIESIHH